MSSTSATIEEDKSQPPTPDGTGLPVNFHQIDVGIYRSSYPQAAHLDSLRAFKFKTVISLVSEPVGIDKDDNKGQGKDGIDAKKPKLLTHPRNIVTPQYYHHDIQTKPQHHYIPIPPNKPATNPTTTPTAPNNDTTISNIALIITHLRNPATHPLILHCNKGKHRTGCAVACYRLTTGWSIAAAVAEYERFAHPKARDGDRAFIRRWGVGIGSIGGVCGGLAMGMGMGMATVNGNGGREDKVEDKDNGKGKAGGDALGDVKWALRDMNGPEAKAKLTTKATAKATAKGNAMGVGVGVGIAVIDDETDVVTSIERGVPPTGGAGVELVLATATATTTAPLTPTSTSPTTNKATPPRTGTQTQTQTQTQTRAPVMLVK